MNKTLFLTVNLIDRFLSKQSVVRKKLQLVGLVSMLLAYKYEEVLEMVLFFGCDYANAIRYIF